MDLDTACPSGTSEVGRQVAVPRDVSELADAFEKALPPSGKANLCVLSEDEAKRLAKELGSRGWKAKAEQGLQGLELKVIDYVRVNGRKKERR